MEEWDVYLLIESYSVNQVAYYPGKVSHFWKASKALNLTTTAKQMGHFDYRSYYAVGRCSVIMLRMYACVECLRFAF